MEKTTDNPVLPALRELEVGESVTYPIARLSYLRFACVNFGLQWGKKFATKLNREQETVTATRMA